MPERAFCLFAQVFPAAGGAEHPAIGVVEVGSLQRCSFFGRLFRDAEMLCLPLGENTVPHGSVLRSCRGGSAFGQLLPEFFASCEVISSAAVPRAPHSHIELGHILLTGTTPALGGVGAVITEVEASQDRAVIPLVHHVPPVLVAVGGGQSAIKIPQRAGAFFKARRVPEQKDRAEAALYIGGQLGSSSHGQIGGTLGLGLSVGVVESVDVEGHDHLAVAVAVFAVGGQCILQSVHGVLGQIVGGHHGHVIIGLGDKEILSAKTETGKRQLPLQS